MKFRTFAWNLKFNIGRKNCDLVIIMGQETFPAYQDIRNNNPYQQAANANN